MQSGKARSVMLREANKALAKRPIQKRLIEVAFHVTPDTRRHLNAVVESLGGIKAVVGRRRETLLTEVIESRVTFPNRSIANVRAIVVPNGG